MFQMPIIFREPLDKRLIRVVLVQWTSVRVMVEAPLFQTQMKYERKFT